MDRASCSLICFSISCLVVWHVSRVLHERHQLLELSLGVIADLDLDGHNFSRTHRTDGFSLEDTFHLRVVRWHLAIRALRVILHNHMLAGSKAEWKQVLAARAVKFRLRDLKTTRWARSQRLSLILCLNRTSRDTFDF